MQQNLFGKYFFLVLIKFQDHLQAHRLGIGDLRIAPAGAPPPRYVGQPLADMAARRLGLQVAVSYYGGNILNYGEDAPACPVQYHFGSEDAHIPMDLVDQIKAARPDGEFYVYEGAGHGFNCDDRADYHAESAALARQRALAFLEAHLTR